MPIPLSHQNESYILKNFVCFCINETFFYYWCIKLIQQVLGIINSIKGLNQKENFFGLIQNYSKLYYVSAVYVFQGETWVYLHLLSILENLSERFSYKRACSNFFIWSFCFFLLREPDKSIEILSGFKSIEFS